MKQLTRIKSGYKPSPLGPIPLDWNIKELGKVFEFKNGINAGKESYGQGVRFINVMEVINNWWINSSDIPGFITISETQKELYAVKKGDVLFNRTSETTDEVGLTSVYLGNENVVFGGFVIRGRPIDSSIDQNFKKYCFRSKILRDQIITKGQGVVRSNIGQAELEKVQLPLPSLKEQISIAKILGLWDQSISHTTQLIAQKELRKKWLMQQLLTGKKRLKGFKGEWKEVKFGDVTTNFSRRNKNLIDAKVYSVTNTNGFVLQSEHFEREVAGDDLTNYKIIKRNEFAYNPARINVGSIAYFKNTIGVISSLYVCFSTKKEILDYYLFQFLQLDHTKHRIESLGEGGVRIYLWYDLFAKIKIKLPSIAEQTAIVNVLQGFDKEIDLHRIKLDRLQEQKKGLMQILLTGKKRLKF